MTSITRYYNKKGQIIDEEPNRGPYYYLDLLDCAGMHIRIYKEYAHSMIELAEVSYDRLYVEGEKDYRFAKVYFRVGNYREYFENKNNINLFIMIVKIQAALSDLPKSLVDDYIKLIIENIIEE